MARLVTIGMRDTLIIVGASTIVALTVNALRGEGLHLIAESSYETMVPCPIAGGPVDAYEPDDPALRASDIFWIDARSDAEPADLNLPSASRVPYDYLDATPDETIRAIATEIAKSNTRRVVVFGDGDNPDSGEQLGKEISAAGIKHVSFVRGGAAALGAARAEAR